VENVERTMRFFNYTGVIIGEPVRQYVIVVPGMTRKLLFVQAHEVVEFLLMRSQTISAFVNHAMGIGKTTMAIAVHVINHTLSIMRNEISLRPQQHLDGQARKADPVLQCPSNNKMLQKYGFDCPCSRANLSSHIRTFKGPTTMLAPSSLAKTWRSEWQACFGLREELPCGTGIMDYVFVWAHNKAYSKSGAWRNGCEEFAMAEALPSTPDTYKSVPPGPADMTFNVQSSRIFILTTSQSFPTNVVTRLVRPYTYIIPATSTTTRTGRPKENPATRETILYSCFLPGSIWIDEAHKERLETSAASTALKMCIKLFKATDHPPMPIHPMSGTMMVNGAIDLHMYTSKMVQAAKGRWEAHPVLKKFSNDELKTQGAAFDKAIRATLTNETTIIEHANLLREFVDVVTLRVNETTKWLDGTPILKLPRNEYFEIECALDPYWQARLSNYENERTQRLSAMNNERKKAQMDRVGHLRNFEPLKVHSIAATRVGRLYATWPKLLYLVDHGGVEWKWTQAEWSNWVNHNPNDDSSSPVSSTHPFYGHLQDIIDTSPKATYIRDRILALSRAKDAEGKIPRIVICSEFYTTTKLITLVPIMPPPAMYTDDAANSMLQMLTTMMGISEKDVLHITKLDEQRAIDILLDIWHDNSDPDQPRIMVATTGAMAVGLTLAEAQEVIMVEPNSSAAVELQSFCRHWRQGNMNPVVFSRQLVNPNHPAEQACRLRNRRRKGLGQTVTGGDVSLVVPTTPEVTGGDVSLMAATQEELYDS
jgi:hypothetical protein